MIQEHNRKARGITKLILMVPPGGIHYYIQKNPKTNPLRMALLGWAKHHSKVKWLDQLPEQRSSGHPHPHADTPWPISAKNTTFSGERLWVSPDSLLLSTHPAYQWPNKKFRHTLLWTLDWNCYMKFIYAKQRVLVVSPALFLKTSRELSCKEGFYLRE